MNMALSQLVVQSVRKSSFPLINSPGAGARIIVEQMMRWPGMRERFGLDDFAQVIEEAADTKLLYSVQLKSPDAPDLALVLVANLDSPLETAEYVHGQAMRAIGEDFGRPPNHSNQRMAHLFKERLIEVQLQDGIQFRPNSLRFEAVDLGQNWSQGGFVPRQVRGSNPGSGFSVLYAAAQNPAWFRRMTGEPNAPFPIATGVEITCLVDRSVYAPAFIRMTEGGRSYVWLSGARFDTHHHGCSLPMVKDYTP